MGARDHSDHENVSKKKEPASGVTPAQRKVAHSLARRLSGYAETLLPEERALLAHMLLNAVGPHVRARLVTPADLLSERESALLDSLAKSEE